MIPCATSGVVVSCSVRLDRNGYHISWDAIPAWVCEQCGESLFETPEVDTIQSAIATLDRNTTSLIST
jgi:YgiT-type zinc finger domain-containing protein